MLLATSHHGSSDEDYSCLDLIITTNPSYLVVVSAENHSYNYPVSNTLNHHILFHDMVTSIRPATKFVPFAMDFPRNDPTCCKMVTISLQQILATL